MALFLRKEKKREWSEGGSAAADGGLGTAEDEASGGDGAVQLVYPEVISSLDEIHNVGTLAQVWERQCFCECLGGGVCPARFSVWYDARLHLFMCGMHGMSCLMVSVLLFFFVESVYLATSSKGCFLVMFCRRRG